MAVAVANETKTRLLETNTEQVTTKDKDKHNNEPFRDVESGLENRVDEGFNKEDLLIGSCENKRTKPWVARWATCLLFFTWGFSNGSWIAGIPGMKEGFDLSDGGLGLALLTMGIGVLIMLYPIGLVVENYGARPLTITVGVLCPILSAQLPTVAMAGHRPFLLLFIIGFVGSGGVVAYNTHAASVQRAYFPQQITSQFHAFVSIGQMTATSCYAFLNLNYSGWEASYPLLCWCIAASSLVSSLFMSVGLSDNPLAPLNQGTTPRDKSIDASYVSLNHETAAIDAPYLNNDQHGQEHLNKSTTLELEPPITADQSFAPSFLPSPPQIVSGETSSTCLPSRDSTLRECLLGSIRSSLSSEASSCPRPSSPFVPVSRPPPTDPARKRFPMNLVPQEIDSFVCWLSILVLLALVTDGSVGDWLGIFLIRYKQVHKAQASLCLTAYGTGMLLSRLCGDPIRERFGARRLFIGSCLVCSLGFFAVHRIDAFPPFVASGIVGIGVGNLMPILFSLAGSAPKCPPALAIAIVVIVGQAGTMSGPCVVGALAALTSLYNAFYLPLLYQTISCVIALVSPSDHFLTKMEKIQTLQGTHEGSPMPSMMDGSSDEAESPLKIRVVCHGESSTTSPAIWPSSDSKELSTIASKRVSRANGSDELCPIALKKSQKAVAEGHKDETAMDDQTPSTKCGTPLSLDSTENPLRLAAA